MPEDYRNTNLWIKSLGNSSSIHGDKISILRVAYEQFRSQAFHLTAQISNALPNLTVHDGTHLDALWETADLIAGQDYPLNPMEGFIFGAAILLHDAALCFEAYEGGRDGLRETLEWKDCFYFASQRSPDADSKSILDEADFSALRVLHAKQAETLAQSSWKLPNGDQIYLLPDGNLRRTYGTLIGQIAASHHWPIEELSKLGNQINSPGTFPREWRVDPIKIACLLRCADAAHIDNRRAPEFLFALARRQGISADHWIAQQWLERADIDLSDETAQSIVFTSTNGFVRDDASAWWVAHDAIMLVDQEIRASNKLLSSRPRVSTPPFQVKRVTGADTPEKLSKHVLAIGWHPCSARIHVGNVEKLVSELGGTRLYGEHDPLSVVLRELLQNARDAVAARRAMHSEYSEVIRVTAIVNDFNECEITVEDNGIGMSHRVLTGPLLDFGNSFWATSLVQEEFPGLRSSGFRPSGKFGIGFYSVFMVAKSLKVSSKRWDAGHSDRRTLHFPNGLTLRPTLTPSESSDFSHWASTTVTMRVKDRFSTKNGIDVEPHRVGQESFRVSMPEYLATLSAGLDVDVQFSSENGEPVIVHKSVLKLDDLQSRIEWLKGISFFESGNRHVSAQQIEKIASRLRFVDPHDKGLGLAALSPSLDHAATFLNVSTIGGLSSNIHGRDSTKYHGFLDFAPASAKRDSGTIPVVSRQALERWAQEQLKILHTEKLEPIEWVSVTYSLSEFSIDPTVVFKCLFLIENQYRIFDMDEILNALKSPGIAIYKSNIIDHIETHHQNGQFRNYPTFAAIRNSGFLSLKKGSESGAYDYSFISCVNRYVQANGLRMNLQIVEKVATSTFGPIDVLLLTAAPLRADHE